MPFHFKMLVTFLDLLRIQSSRAFLCSFLATFCVIPVMDAYERYKMYCRGVSISYENSTLDTPRSFGKSERVVGPFLPNADITQRDYAADGSLKRSHTFHANNLGWVSRINYAEAKRYDEFRIAVVGDSFVASVTSETQWVDVMQRGLAQDKSLLDLLGVRTISALNLGVPGHGPANWETLSLPIAQRFQADLLIVGFVIESLARPAAATHKTTSEITLGNTRIQVVCRDSDATCPLWTVPIGKELQPSEIIEIRRALAKAALRRELLRPQLYLFDGLVGQSAPPMDGQYTDYVPALTTFERIRKHSPSTVFVLIPPPWYFNSADEKVGRFLSIAQAAGIHILDGRTVLPQISAGERSSWYIERDGHFSNEGNELLGRAMAATIHQRLLASRATHSKAKEPIAGTL